MRCMIDYSQKMEKTLKELRSLLKPTEDQPEQTGTPGAGPSTTPAPTASFVTPSSYLTGSTVAGTDSSSEYR